MRRKWNGSMHFSFPRIISHSSSILPISIISLNDLRTLIESYAKTLRSLFTDGGALLFCIVVPLIYPVLYTMIYNGEVVHEVPVAVVDDRPSTLSRDFLRRLDGTPDIRVVAHCADIDEAKRLVEQRDCYGIVRIPAEFTRDLHVGRQAHVQAYSDMSGMLYYKAILTACTEVSLDMGAEIKVAQTGANPVAGASHLQAATPAQQQAVQHPVRYEYVNIYNPQTGFATFLIPAVLILAIQQTMILGIGLIAGTRRERGVRVTPGRNVMMQLFGVALGFLTLYIPVCFYEFGVVPRMFDLPQLANPWHLAWFTLPFLLAVFNFGMCIGSIPRRRESIILLVVFTTIPMLFMSGVSWPGSALPPFWRYLGYLFPSTFGINAFVKLNAMGAPFEAIRPEYVALWIQTAVYACLAWALNKFEMAYAPDGDDEKVV